MAQTDQQTIEKLQYLMREILKRQGEIDRKVLDLEKSLVVIQRRAGIY